MSFAASSMGGLAPGAGNLALQFLIHAGEAFTDISAAVANASGGAAFRAGRWFHR